MKVSRKPAVEFGWSKTLVLMLLPLQPALSDPGEIASVITRRYLPATTVSADSVWLPEATLALPAVQETLRVQDSAELLLQVPGTAVVRNGPLTGIVQVRGLSGDRVKISLDGMAVTPACPNHMDPPLHYVSPNSLEMLTVLAGVTPVSQGGDSLGGTVLVDVPAPRFATNARPLLFGELGGAYHSRNDGYGFNGRAGIANQSLSATYNGWWETAQDLRFPGGRVRDSGYDTQQHGILAALRTGKNLWSTDAGFTRTREAGTPALPMDMIKDDSYRVGLKQSGNYDFGEVESRVFYHNIDHLMDNYSLRPLALGTMRMFSPADSQDMGLNLALSLPREVHTVRLGTGFHLNAFNAYQQNAATGARQNTIHDGVRTVIGTYAEWQSDWSDRWTTLVGVRNDTVLSDVAAIDNTFAAAAADRVRFNAQEHDFVDPDFDFTAAVRYTPGHYCQFELAVARKSRAPSLIERYLWTPLSASAGQADGRTYLGNLELDPEVSHQVAATADFHGDRWQVKVSPFYNFVSDYIQGRPISRMDTAGRPVLQFQNVGRADLFGAEAMAEYSLNNFLKLQGTVSYTRGINRDNGDSLYRIAPLRGTIALEHHWKAWNNALELMLVDSQNQVAQYNGEQRTPGYLLLNLRVGYTLFEHLVISVALENLLNERYADHLGGINRVLNSDVPVGDHIPGAGRAVSVGVQYRF